MYRLTYTIDYSGQYKGKVEHADIYNRLCRLLDSIPPKITKYHTKFNDTDKKKPHSDALFKMCLYLPDVDKLQAAIIFFNQYCTLNHLPLDEHPDIITMTEDDRY
jgi:hypothetical protein